MVVRMPDFFPNSAHRFEIFSKGSFSDIEPLISPEELTSIFLKELKYILSSME
ncbi:unknown [Coraliomargarita sp. CAG:312]|nr:unknown [Coraliomargarita sp. CAG:312]